MPENFKNPLDYTDDGIDIVDLYPELTPEEQAEAEASWLQYLAVVKRIFKDVCREKPEILTELEKRARLRKETGNL